MSCISKELAHTATQKAECPFINTDESYLAWTVHLRAEWATCWKTQNVEDNFYFAVVQFRVYFRLADNIHSSFYFILTEFLYFVLVHNFSLALVLVFVN